MKNIKCKGENCNSINGKSHSLECLAEFDKSFNYRGDRMMKRVFLGGTCNESTWRNIMMVHLHDDGLEYFNPVVDDWNDEAQANEIREREGCDFCLYTITPKMTGTYSIAEVVDDSNKRPDKTVLVLMEMDGREIFNDSQWKSLGSVSRLVSRNGGRVFDNLKSASIYMRDKK